MEQTYASTDQGLNHGGISEMSGVQLPLPPESYSCDAQDYMAIYARFMRYLRHVPNSRMEIKVLSAIQFTADMLDHSDAHVSKVLVEQGLRAPRIAFPSDFLSFFDKAIMRQGWEIGGASAGMIELRQYWDQTGEDRFAMFKSQHQLRSIVLQADA